MNIRFEDLLLVFFRNTVDNETWQYKAFFLRKYWQRVCTSYIKGAPRTVLRIRCFLPLDPGWKKNSDPESVMNKSDHFSESFKTFFGLKILKFFDADPDLLTRDPDLLTPDPGWKNLDPGP